MKKTKKKTMVTSISLFVAVCIAAMVLASQVVNAVIFGSNVREDSRTLLRTQATDTAEIIGGWLDRQAGIMNGMRTSLILQNDLDHTVIMDFLEAQVVQTISERIGELSDTVQIIAASAEESAGSSEEMSAQAALLTDLVGRFRLPSRGRERY